ncbi:MAG: hypothetical protein Q9217_000246 [Psora testacea]
MTARVTRGHAAKEAAFLALDKENAIPQFSSPPVTLGSLSSKAKRRHVSKKATIGSQLHRVKAEIDDQAPHSMPISPSRNTEAMKDAAVAGETDRKTEEHHAYPSPVGKAGKKRKRSVKAEDPEKYVELQHNMRSVPEAPEGMEEGDAETEESTAKHRATKRTPVRKGEPETPAQSAAKSAKAAKDAERALVQLTTVKAKFAEEEAKRETAIESGKKTKSESYGLCEGKTPFPRWQHPTPEECQEVHHILLKHHPDVHPQPKTISPPSEFVAGCGEVRSILDALIRTRLSASTTGRNSNAAYQGMVKRYGLLKSGVGMGSVDYNAVRLAPVQDLFHAIKNGGLAVSKSADIKALLDLVYQENQTRRKELLAAQAKNNSLTAPKGADTENDTQKAAEIKLAEDENLSLDHLYTLPTYDAIYKMMNYPGIGVKTAACVAMFCMQRPCFAVDTHVFRLAKWLGWVPPPTEKVKGEKAVDRDTTFSHLEVRVPDHLKYMLHQLFLKHGKTCPRCRGNTGEGSADWGEGCVIEHLVQRTGSRKGGGGDSPVKAKKTGSQARSKKAIDSDDEEDEEEEMPDLHDKDEEDGYLESPTRARTPIKAKPRTTRTTTQIPSYGRSAKATPEKIAKASSPKKTTATASKPKRKSTPANGWKGGKAVRSREASMET